ncbi:MAG: DUF2243 domain-containing protein [Actinomycetes bacterium]
MTTSDISQVRGPVARLPPILLGIGLGGFVDGIVLHQILQWHHLVSDTHEHITTVVGLEANTLADGIFHAFAFIAVLVGVIGLVTAWRNGRLAPTWRSLAGLVLCGWGFFNLVEGVVCHHILGLHHVRDDLGGPASWDIGFLVFALLLILGGCLLQRSSATV